MVCKKCSDYRNNVVDLNDFKDRKEKEKVEKRKKELIKKAIEHSKKLDW